MKNTITEMKNAQERINRRLNDTVEGIDDLEDRIVEITQSEQQNEKQIKNKNSLRNLWDNIKHTNIRIIGIKGEEREKNVEMYLIK